MKKGNELGDWTLEEEIGKGGNGAVWRAINSSGDVAAVKVLHAHQAARYHRFRTELSVLEQLRGDPGVLSVMDSHLPETPTSNEPAWYAMKIAEPLMKVVEQYEIERRLEVLIAVAETMSRLHGKKIAHRDLKPDNLLWCDGSAKVSDFGLATYPEKSAVTKEGERVGPYSTIAPEMRHYEPGANAYAADVFSMAKTLWVVITGETDGFEGQYVAVSETIGLKRWCSDLPLDAIDSLLSSATDHDPSKRPTMLEFHQQLLAWWSAIGKFESRNKLEWDGVRGRIFEVATPTRSVWERLDDIVNVLNEAGRDNLNHMFFPDGGGLDFISSAKSDDEPGWIELNAQGYICLVRPKQLLFEHTSRDSQWDYFRLETEGADRAAVYANSRPGSKDRYAEPLVDLGRKRYIDINWWDEGEFEGIDLRKGARVVHRYFREGSFVIFRKTSVYNRISGTYDARHAKMTADEFRNYIKGVKRAVRAEQRRRERLGP